MVKDDHKEDNDDKVVADSNNVNVKLLRAEKQSVLTKALSQTTLSLIIDELLALEKRARLVSHFIFMYIPMLV